MMTEIRKTELNLESLLQVLGDNLYSTPIVAIRELIQNSYDASIRRRIENEWHDTPIISIHTDQANQRLSIQDQGSGLTRDEIIKYLATIGSGYTRVLRQKTEDETAVGYFGLGFLTSYVVADKVEFLTTSYQDEKTGWKFSSKGGQNYQLDQVAAVDVGSTVTLSLKNDFAELSDPDFLLRIIQKYCCLLPIDIYLNDSADPVNRLEIPWELAENKASEIRQTKANLAFAQLFDHSFEPIAAKLEVSDDDCKFKALIWIQDGSYYSSSDNRVTSIFIRSMHITDECKDLLPEWAGFVGCVVDTPMLTPTASRESVKDDDAFFRVKEKIKLAIVGYLSSIAEEGGANWRRIASRHNQSLLGAAVSDYSLFTAMNQQLSIPTSEGELTIDQVLARMDDEQLRVSMDENGGYEQLVSKSVGIPVIYGYRYAVSRFCHLVSEQRQLGLLALGTREAEKNLFPEYEVSADIVDMFKRYFETEGCQLIVSHYEPASLPLLHVFDQDALLKKRIESDGLDRNIGIAALSLAREFTQSVNVEAESYLYINMNSDIIKAFIELSDEQKKVLATILLNISVLLGSVPQEKGGHMTAVNNLHANLLTMIKGYQS